MADTLPPELLVAVFERVDRDTLLGVVPEVCRRWHALYRDVAVDVHFARELPPRRVTHLRRAAISMHGVDAAVYSGPVLAGKCIRPPLRFQSARPAKLVGCCTSETVSNASIYRPVAAPTRRDLAIVFEQTGVDDVRAVHQALVDNDNDIVNAIMDLTV